MNRRLIEKADALISKERGTVFKEPGGRINICLVYPNTYHVGMSNLGFQGIYAILNERDDIVCERAFLPNDEDIDEYSRTDTELFSIESKKPLNRFDIVAFSVSFENDYLNIIRILQLSKIPCKASERNISHPLIMFGGVCAFFNPEPIADFFDICFIGEAEEMLDEFIEMNKASATRDALLRNSSGIEGVYIPKFYKIFYGNGIIRREKIYAEAPDRIKKRHIKDISSHRFRHSIITSETEFSETYLIEAMRGCPWKCRFCVAGHIYNPPRQKGLSVIREEVREALKCTGRVGLIGPSMSDYAHASDVLSIEGVDFSITSLRASQKSARIVSLMKGHKSISIAPETGTERLRRVVDKNITDEEIIEASRLILSESIENLRLYFMIGLPTEKDEDINGIVSLVKKIRDASKKGNITITLSTFIPKPFTPFQWHPMERMDVVKERLRKIKKSLLPAKGVRVFHDVPKYAYMQGLFSMGDRRLSEAIEKTSQTQNWRKACTDSGIDPDFYTMRKRYLSEDSPWDFIDTGIPKEKLWEEYQKAVS